MMLEPLFFILAGIGLLYLGAEGLVRGSASIATRLGLTPLVIGLTVVALGTSMPEMVVSLGATLAGNGAIAAGNVIGSNIGNIELILGTCALIHPLAVHSQIIRVDVPVLILVSSGLVLLLGDGLLSRITGGFLVGGLLLYIGMSLRLARRESEAVRLEFAEATPRGPKSPGVEILFVAGANDYCTLAAFGDVWTGFYVSADSGHTWINSFNPGYPGDNSGEGQASPLPGRNTAAGDPIIDWDNGNRLFYGGIAFKRTEPNASGFVTPSNGHVFVSTWMQDPAAPVGMDHLRTVIVGEGTPSAFFAGRFNDKPSLRVDDWPGSPHDGNVYVAWALFLSSGQNQILFARSTNHGETFSRPIKLNMGEGFHQGTDIAVAPDGTVYVVWRRFAGFPPTPNVADEVVFVKSTDGGQTFGKSQTVRPFVDYRRQDRYTDGTFARDCGDGPFLCQSGFVFHRVATLPQAVVDGNGHLYVSWEEVVRAPDNGDSYRPDGQARVVVSRSTDGGASWSGAVPIDPQGSGHQWWPNLEYDQATGTLVAIYYDSREDPGYSVHRPPGNTADGTNACGVPAPATCNVLNTFMATSPDGQSWSAEKITSVGHQPEYEIFGNLNIPFHGDYLWIDAVAGTVFGVWTDNRDVVPGVDVRDSVQDGFDVRQCRESPDAPDTCPNAGGRNQNIYGFRKPLP